MQIPARAKPYEGHPLVNEVRPGALRSRHRFMRCDYAVRDCSIQFPSLKIIVGSSPASIIHIRSLAPRCTNEIFPTRVYRQALSRQSIFGNNFFVTTSGIFCDPSFRCAIEVKGVDRMMFSARLSIRKMEDARGGSIRRPSPNPNVCRSGEPNAIKLFNLDLK
jgi:hypothetical protein